MIIDFHTHTFPEKIAQRAISSMQASSHAAAFSNGTSAALKASMAGAGITYSVVLPVATNPTKLASMNDFSIENNGNDKAERRLTTGSLDRQATKNGSVAQR